MKIMNYWRKFLCIALCWVISDSVVCQGQKNEKEVVYRDYTHMETDLLDSLKRDEVKTLFRGNTSIAQENDLNKSCRTKSLDGISISTSK